MQNFISRDINYLVMVTKTGWYNKNMTGNPPKYESHRHSLASRGIKTALPKGSRIVSSGGSPTPNFDIVANSKTDMIIKYPEILKGLGIHTKDVFVKNNKIHVSLYGKWHRVEKETLILLHDLKEAFSGFLNQYDITSSYKTPIEAPYGKKTIFSYGHKKVPYNVLKKLEKIPFLKKGFAEKHKGKSKNIVYRDILDRLPILGHDFTRKDSVGYQDLLIAKDAMRRLKKWEVQKLT